MSYMGSAEITTGALPDFTKAEQKKTVVIGTIFADYLMAA